MSEKSDPILKGIIDVPKGEVVLLLESGYLLMQLKRHKEAQEIFSGVAALLPHSDVPCVAMGSSFLSLGKYDLAMKEIQKAIKRVPTSALAYAHLGEALLFQKKTDEAVAALEKAIELEPKGATATFARELISAKDRI